MVLEGRTYIGGDMSATFDISEDPALGGRPTDFMGNRMCAFMERVAKKRNSGHHRTSYQLTRLLVSLRVRLGISRHSHGK